MKSMKALPLFLAFIYVSSGVVAAQKVSPFTEGLDLYKAGRFSDANEAFESATKSHDHEKEARQYLDRIRKETVERIRNRALTGIPKGSWQSPFYYINTIQNRIEVGISIQELFERGSLNFRPGALAALSQLAAVLRKTDTGRVDVQIISEIPLETQPDPATTAQQEAQVFSYLSLATSQGLPKF
jgi:hypothetical protein